MSKHGLWLMIEIVILTLKFFVFVCCLLNWTFLMLSTYHGAKCPLLNSFATHKYGSRNSFVRGIYFILSLGGFIGTVYMA